MQTRKDQIRLQAQTLFRERGYSATSMRDIAESLGIEAASLYNHIHSKEQLLQEICFSMAEHFFDSIEPITTSTDTAPEKLQAAIKSHLAVIAIHKDASAVFLHEWRHLQEPYLSQFILQRKRYEKLFRTILDTGISNGDFRQMNIPLTVRTILSAMNWTYDYSAKRKIDSLQISEQISALILNGILK